MTVVIKTAKYSSGLLALPASPDYSEGLRFPVAKVYIVVGTDSSLSYLNHQVWTSVHSVMYLIYARDLRNQSWRKIPVSMRLK